MTTKFFALLTNQGAAKLANATALGTQLQITHMAVGDGGGALPLPNAAQTQLIGEKRRAALNSLSVDAANSSQIIAEQVIPETDGGWWIREIGLFDKDGVLIAIANCPETYKPQLQEGSGRTQTVRMVLIVSSTEAVTLKIDPSVVLATRKYVDDKVIEVRTYTDNLLAAHLVATDPHTQYAPKASPSLTGKPLAPTAVKTDNSTQLATTAHVKLVAADYATLADPALTGKPTAPTATKADNSTQLANTAFVQAAISDLGLAGMGIGLLSMTGIDNFDFQTFIFVSGANYLASSTNWINVPSEISYPAGLAISIKVDYVTGTQIGLEIKPSTVSSTNFRAWYLRLGGYPGSRTFTAREIQTSANPVSISCGGTGATTATGALAGLGLTAIGIGLPIQTDIQNFDWQNFVFTAGANYVTSYSTWVNSPDGVTYNAGTRVSIRVIYISSVNGHRMGLEITPDTGVDANFKVYELLCVGAAGSRVFTFRQDWNSANPIPITGGGTGATTVAGALANFGIGDGSLVPIGVPLPYPLATPPTGFLKCNGSSFGTATYPKLALMYPSGVVPDLRGEFIRGWDGGRGLNPSQGLLEWRDSDIKSHSHQVSPQSANKAGGGSTVYATPDLSGGGGPAIMTSSVGGTETLPRNIAFNYIVRAI
ncbi:phage tail protein [Yersinia sp. LJYL362]|uniref:phage tail-collar fiber domain-containing protein n=1 Tax=Yersinia sp. LJYL362 TaxID=3402108 RepID=UPI003AB25341